MTAGDLPVPEQHVVLGHRYDARTLGGHVRAHLTQRGYAVLREVASEPVEQKGRMVSRRVDLVGVRPDEPRVVAVEVKSSRQDFVADVRNPDKQAPWMAAAGQHYYAAPAGLIDPALLPAGSGLIEVFRLRHPIGKEYDEVRVTRQAPRADPTPALPDWLVSDAFQRAAYAEAVLAGWEHNTTPSVQLRVEIEALRSRAARAEARADRALEREAAWKALAAAQGHKIPCAHCGAPVQPTRVSAGALAGWRHSQPHLTTDCPGERLGITPREDTTP